MTRSRLRDGPLLALTLLPVLAAGFGGRAVTTSDGAEVVSEALSVVVSGRFIPVTASAGELAAFPAGGRPSKYGLFPSLLPLPFAAAAWPLQGWLGAKGLDAAVALTWTSGVALSALAFLALVRRLKPGASPFWAAGLVAGTFLWPYAADSFVEPWAAAALAFGAARLLDAASETSSRAPLVGGLAWTAACLLKPFLWLTVPVAFLALAVARRDSGRPATTLAFLAAPAAGLVAALAVNLARYGSLLEFGYGDDSSRFTTPFLEGFSGLLLSPGRSILLLAPIVVGALAAAKRVPATARILCYGVPLLLVLVIARWAWWNGATAWGPRLLLPALPLLAAPAVLLPAAAAGTLLALGVLVNAPGVLVAPGAWISFVETLRVPEAAGWPPKGSERVSDVPCLAPVRGHLWLLARAAGSRSPVPCASAGASETGRPPSATASVSPLLVRALAGLPPPGPSIPRILVRMATGHVARGEEARARLFAAAALRLAPGDPDAKALLGLSPPRPAR